MNSLREDAAAGDELTALRALLGGDARPQVEALARRLDAHEAAHGERLAAELPAAVEARSSRDQALGHALATPVERALRLSIARDPAPLVEAISPIIGSAIRKAVADALVGLVQSFNVALDNSLSPRALGWRLEAWRTGHSFAEVALLHSLVFRVEQIFLIHRETGLVLQHVVAPTVVANDADMVSGMLTAIQDFVRDSFGAAESADLDAMQVGPMTVWVERSRGMALAAAIRGVAPATLRLRMQDTLAEIERRFGHHLARFRGDPAPFEPARELLEPRLEQQQRQRSRSGGLAVLLALLGLGAAGYWLWSLWTAPPPASETVVEATPAAASDPWAPLLARLQRTRGLVVLEATTTDGARLLLRGLRDPLAPDPAAITAELGLDASRVTADWIPFQSLEPELVEARAVRALQPPDGARLTYTSGELHIEGTAPRAWLDRALALAPALGGVERLDVSAVVIAGAAEWEAAVAAVERVQIHFRVGSSELDAQQLRAIDDVRRALVELDRRAVDLARAPDVLLVGHHDNTGSPARNTALRLARADAVMAALQDADLRRVRLRPVLSTEDHTLDGRYVNFRIATEVP